MRFATRNGEIWESMSPKAAKPSRLREYAAKRRPGETPEPGTGRKRAGRSRKPIFVVQRHDARRLHYDFRLERDGVLASWAVPKGIPLESGVQHLAVHVEDHPLEYATFEGEIPAGQYGAGAVEIWDRGTYDLVEEKRDGGLTVDLHGGRLRGLWTLVPARLGGDEKNWLIVRKREQPAAGPRRRYRPMLASLTERLPRGADWWFEPKWDGYRAIAYLVESEVELRSRRDQDLTRRFEPVATALPRAVRTPNCVLDGEVCALDERGRSSFSLMQQGLGRLVYYVFDVLEVDREPVTALPLEERRERLEAILDRRSQAVRLSEAFEDGEALLEAAREQGLEGVMAKKRGSAYEEKRSRSWLKVKVRPQQEFVVAGYTRGQGRRSRLGSLVLAVRERGELRWVGNVGTGFTETTIDELLAALGPLERDEPPFRAVPKMPRVRKGDVTWVEPKLVAQIEYAEWTHDGHLRAPSFLGLRDDKRAAEVRRELPLEPEIRKGRRTLRLSNLDKPFWPEEGITKGDLLSYYREIAPVIVPHLANRPFTMKRYPDGWKGPHFFQKQPTSSAGKAHLSVKGNFFFVNDELDLLAAVNLGCIDMNTWLSRIDKPGRPDFVMFDLDPAPDVGWPEVVEVTLLVKQLLDGLGLVSYAKTSGADGMHVLVPIARRSTYRETREFVDIVRRALASTHPGLVTAEWARAKRRGVLVDANQNREGATTANVYSVRPRAGAPVSTPLRWEEVNRRLDPASFTMDAVLERVAVHGDLFAGVLEGRQSLAKALRAVR